MIVNVSAGGGCPDVPYLAQEMVGQDLWKTPRRPSRLGTHPSAAMPCNWHTRR